MIQKIFWIPAIYIVVHTEHPENFLDITPNRCNLWFFTVGWALGVNAVKHIFFHALTIITLTGIGVDHSMVCPEFKFIKRCNGSGPVRQQLSESAIQAAYPSRKAIQSAYLSRQAIQTAESAERYVTILP